MTDVLRIVWSIYGNHTFVSIVNEKWQMWHAPKQPNSQIIHSVNQSRITHSFPMRILSLNIMTRGSVSVQIGKIFPNFTIIYFYILWWIENLWKKIANEHKFEIDANFWSPSTFTTLNHVILWFLPNKLVNTVSKQLKFEFNWIACYRLDLNP